jgi:2-deoxy-D-gluconate 3-dehydrogenase
MTTSIKNLLDLTGKTAIVTGGGLGIGYGISYRLAEAGANVVIADRTEAHGITASEKILSNGWNSIAVKTDISIETEVKNMVKKTTESYGKIDILVNNAGIFPSIPLEKMSFQDFRKVLSINLDGLFLCTKYVSEQMISQGTGGKIINITSIDALHPSSPGLAHYDASKHGAWGFTKTAALELAQHNIMVNAIAPGGIDTPGVQSMMKPVSSEAPGLSMEKIMKSFMERIPLHRLGDPDEIGKVALFLASEMSSYMTGSQIVVDGGALLM